MKPVVLHLSPHPDDELIGAPATLMALRDAGWRVVNLACGLGGRPERRAEREEELREACARARFDLLLPDRPPLGSTRGDEEAERAALLGAVGEAIAELRPAALVSPSPADRHPAHATVARVARVALGRCGVAPPRWWGWTLWGALEGPSLACGFDSSRLEEILAALGAHRGELERADYGRLVRARAELAACQAPELLFGFGSAARPEAEMAELLTESVPLEGRWWIGAARWLDPAAPLAEPSDVEVYPAWSPSAPGSRG